MQNRSMRVWDLPTRLFHRGLVALIAIDEEGPFVGSVSETTVRSATKLHHIAEPRCSC